MKKRNKNDLKEFKMVFEDLPRKSYRLHITKYLTIKRRWPIIKHVKLKRKDDNQMAKDKTNMNLLQAASLFLLAIAAAFGITELLGGSIVDAAIAVILATLLFIQVYDF